MLSTQKTKGVVDYKDHKISPSFTDDFDASEQAAFCELDFRRKTFLNKKTNQDRIDALKRLDQIHADILTFLSEESETIEEGLGELEKVRKLISLRKEAKSRLDQITTNKINVDLKKKIEKLNKIFRLKNKFSIYLLNLDNPYEEILSHLNVESEALNKLFALQTQFLGDYTYLEDLYGQLTPYLLTDLSTINSNITNLRIISKIYPRYKKPVDTAIEDQQTLKDEQRKVALKLSETYRTGINGSTNAPYRNSFLANGIYGNRKIAKDEWQAARYLAKATDSNENPDAFGRTATLYNSFGWYSSIRLFILRLDRVLKTTSHNNFLYKSSIPFAFFGFSYGLELLADFYILATSKSARDTLFKDGRVSRMANAAVWLTVNVVTFIVTGGLLNKIANLFCFAFDAANEYYRKRHDLKKYEKLQSKIDQKILALQQKNLLNLKEIDELLKLIETRAATVDKIKDIQKSRNKVIFYTVGIVIGMALFLCFPPTGLIAMAGSVIAFGCGSIFLGLGKRLMETVKKAFDKTPPPIKNKQLKPCAKTNSYINNLIGKVENTSRLNIAKQISALSKDEINFIKTTVKGSWSDNLKSWVSYSKKTNINHYNMFLDHLYEIRRKTQPVKQKLPQNKFGVSVYSRSTH